MKGIVQIRKDIDEIDNRLAELLKRRIEIADEVASIKHASGCRVADPAREREILTRVTDMAGPDNESAIRLVFATLFSITKARQRQLLGGESPLISEIRSSEMEKFPTKAVVACAGSEGSYAQLAASQIFPLPTILYFNDFEKVFEAVEKGLCPYGVLPIENSAAGSVAQVYDLMQKHRFHIVRAKRLKVDHVLLAPKGVKLADVREVVSHQHALNQCSEFIRKHPQLKAVPGLNTAAAAAQVAESSRRDLAVIASRACADLYGLDIIAESITDAQFNYTRFICIAKNLAIYPDSNKISVMMSLPHRPGSLNDIIAKFSSIGVNLTKLESRPVPGLDFEFKFTFDFEARPMDRAVQALMSELSTDPDIECFTFLGAYAEN